MVVWNLPLETWNLRVPCFRKKPFEGSKFEQQQSANNSSLLTALCLPLSSAFTISGPLIQRRVGKRKAFSKIFLNFEVQSLPLTNKVCKPFLRSCSEFPACKLPEAAWCIVKFAKSNYCSAREWKCQ